MRFPQHSLWPFDFYWFEEFHIDGISGWMRWPSDAIWDYLGPEWECWPNDEGGPRKSRSR